MTSSAHVVVDDPSGRSFTCHEEESVLSAMMRHGLQVIPIGCRNGGCGVCKIQVHDGAYAVKKMSRQQISEAEEKQGFVLACRAFPRSRLVFEYLTRATTNVDLRAPRTESGDAK